MNTLEALTAGSTLDIDKNIDKIIAILSTCKTSLEPQEVSTEKREGEEIAHPTEKAAKIDNVCALPRLAHEKWAQIFSVASRRRKITDTSECLSVIIDNLYGVPEVSSVDLSGLMWVTDNVIKMIGSALERAKLFDSVTFVNVDMCEKISFECLYDSILSKAPNITQLSCKFCTQFSCAQLGKLYVRPSLLTSVDFSGLHTVSDSFLTDFFLVFPSVRVLKLDYVSGLAANVLKIVSEKLPSLTHLSLSFSEPQVVIDNATLKFCQNLARLESLEIAGSKMSFLTLEKLVQTLPSLTSLNVLGCEFKSEEVKHAVPGSCAKVQSLVIGGKTLLDDMFSGILKVFSGVTDLDMSGCTKVSGKVVLTTLDGLSSLKVLNATGKHNHIDKQVFTKLKETHPSLVIYTTKKLN